MPNPEDFNSIEAYVAALMHTLADVVDTGIVKSVSFDVDMGGDTAIQCNKCGGNVAVCACPPSSWHEVAAGSEIEPP